ncbi:MAG: peptidase [Bdellovibrionaceae bacterium]|nr:peptidase [Pseudobdellovibrionaceae bacterium]
MKGIVTIIAGLLLMGSVAQASEFGFYTFPDFDKVIYGDDDRVDLYQISNPNWVSRARSTVALVKNSSLRPVENGFTYQQNTLGQRMGLCENERFREQPSLAFCSGFLVAPNMMVTAGHCIQNQSQCNATSFVFDFALSGQGRVPAGFPRKNVYRCKQVLGQRLVGTGEDWAIVEIDRAVTDRRPLPLRRSGVPEVNTPLAVAGHPSGLPLKVAAGAGVRSVNRSGYLVANLDTYGGNSGSAVFNLRTGNVEGILVRGERDYQRSRTGCTQSVRCENNSCRGEDVTLITRVCGINGQPCN